MAASAAGALLLTGCAAGTSPLAASARMVASQWWGDYPDTVPTSLDLRFAYLRLDFDDRPPGIVALGYRDPEDVEVWYSSTQQTFKLQRGRLVGVSGMSLDWSAVHFTPALPDLIAGLSAPAHYTRTRDEMPGHRYGVADRLTAEPWAGQGMPPVALPKAVPESLARGWTWYREVPEAAPPGPALPPSWYAVGLHRGERTIVFSHQCMSPTLCIRFTRWPLID